MSKKYKVLLVFLVLIVIFISVLGIIGGIRFYKLSKIISANKEKAELNNYILRTKIKYNDKDSNVTAYYKDGVGKVVTSNGSYTWSDGTEAYYIDEETQTAYVLDINNSQSIAGYDMFMSMIPGYRKVLTRMKVALNIKNEITTEKIGNKEYTVITIFDEDAKKTIWVDNDSKLVTKAVMEFAAGTKVEYEYTVDFNKVNSINISKPSFSSYVLKSDISEIETKVNEGIVSYITGENNGETVENSNTVSEVVNTAE